MLRLGVIVLISSALLGCHKADKTADRQPAPAAPPPVQTTPVAGAPSPAAAPGWQSQDLSKLVAPTESHMGGKILPHAPWAFTVDTPPGAAVAIGDESSKYDRDGQQEIQITAGPVSVQISDAVPAEAQTLAAAQAFFKDWGPVERSESLPDGGYLLVQKGPVTYSVRLQLHKPPIDCFGDGKTPADRDTALQICRSLKRQ